MTSNFDISKVANSQLYNTIINATPELNKKKVKHICAYLISNYPPKLKYEDVYDKKNIKNEFTLLAENCGLYFGCTENKFLEYKDKSISNGIFYFIDAYNSYIQNPNQSPYSDEIILLLLFHKGYKEYNNFKNKMSLYTTSLSLNEIKKDNKKPFYKYFELNVQHPDNNDDDENTEFSNVKNNDVSNQNENPQPKYKPPIPDPIHQNNEIDLDNKLNVQVDNSNMAPESEQLHQDKNKILGSATNEVNPLNEYELQQKVKNQGYDPPNMEAHERTTKLKIQTEKYNNDEEAQLRAIQQMEDHPLNINNERFLPKVNKPDDNLGNTNKDAIENAAYYDFGEDIESNNKGDLLKFNDNNNNNLSNLPPDTQINSNQLSQIIRHSTSNSSISSKDSIPFFDGFDIFDEDENEIKMHGSVGASKQKDPKFLAQMEKLTGLKFGVVNDVPISQDLLTNYKHGTLNDDGYNNLFTYYAQMAIKHPNSTNFKNLIYSLKKDLLKELATDIKYTVNSEKTLPFEYVQKFLADFNKIRAENPKLDKLITFLDNKYLPGFNVNDLSTYFKNQNANGPVTLNVNGEEITFENNYDEEGYKQLGTEKQNIWKDYIISINTYPANVYQANQKIKEQLIKQAMYDNYERYKYFKLVHFVIFVLMPIV